MTGCGIVKLKKMKKLFVLTFLFTVACTSCKPGKEAPSGGVYQLEKQTVYNGKKDSVFPVSQYKIYMDKYYIFAETGPHSLVLFDVGTYRPDSINTITTHNIFGSRILDSAQDLRIWLSRTDSSYTEFNPKRSVRRGAKYQLTEHYRMLPAAGNTKLDGLWYLYNQQFPEEVSYQAFYRGYFIAVRHKATANSVCFGRFRLQNDSLIEKILMDSDTTLINQSKVRKLNFRRRDEFTVGMTSGKEHYVLAR